ncbi:MAG: sigma-70 family RNA polymerase sigma factor [Planctomycetota bacterium]
MTPTTGPFRSPQFQHEQVRKLPDFSPAGFIYLERKRRLFLNILGFRYKSASKDTKEGCILASHKDFTQFFADLRAGKTGAEEAVFTCIYGELHAIAKSFMLDERTGHTLQTTALVHEAYMKMSGTGGGTLEDKAHFMRLAARAMRRILIDHARRKRAEKRGGGKASEAIEEAEVLVGEPRIDLIALDSALERLSALDAQLAQVVDLRFFGGLTAEEAALALGVSVRKVQYDWRMARAWLQEELQR